MGAGLIVCNDSGNLIIDGTYRNVAVVQSGQLNLENGQLPPTSTLGNYRFVTVNYTGTIPMVAVRPDAVFYRDSQHFPMNYVRVRVVNNGNGNFQFNFSGRGPLTYWIYDIPQSPAASVGLVVRDGSGNLVFHSGYKYLRVVEYAYLDPSSLGLDESVGTQLYYQHAVPSGRAYAIAQNKSVVVIDVDDDLDTGLAAIAWSETCVVLKSDGTLALCLFPTDYSGYVYPSGAVTYNASQTAGSALCVEVTGF